MLETLTLTAVAKRLGVTQPTIYNWIKSGRFPVQPIEGTKPRRWRVEDIEAWRNNRSETMTNAA